MELTEETLQKIKQFGALKYPPSRICTLLGLFGEKAIELMLEFQEAESQVHQFYEQGLAIGDYNIDVKLIAESGKGDLPSITELALRQERTKINDLKKQLFGI